MTYSIRPVLEHFGMDTSRGEGKIRCEFHADETPSASWNRYYFKCFACGVSGDAVRLLHDQEGLSWGEAYRRAEALSGRDHSEIPEVASSGRRVPGRSWLHRADGDGRKVGRGR